LPEVSAEKTYEVFYLRSILYGDGSKEIADFAEANKIYHSAIGISETCVDRPSSLEGFIIEYFAEHVDERLQIPQVKDGKIQFDSVGHLGWYQGRNATNEWKKFRGFPDGVTYIGTASGAQINGAIEKTMSWIEEHPNWQLFSFWQAGQGDVPQVRVRENICHTFTETVLTELYREGADFAHMQDPICRNYLPLLVRDRPNAVEMENKEQFSHVTTYYQELGATMKAAKWRGSIDGVYKWLGSRDGGVYVASQPSSNPKQDWEFWYGNLDGNAMEAIKFIEARMFSLPWQDNSTAKNGECNFRLPEEQSMQVFV